MKKSIAFLLSLTLVLCALPFSAAAVKPEQTLKILVIGNSYGINATSYLSRIAATMGIKVKATTLYKDGCTLKQHYTYMTQNSASYAISVDGSTLQWGHTMDDVLESDTFDLITFQQSPSGCDDFSTYYTEQNPYLTAVADHVREKQSSAQFMIHQTWAFCKECATGEYDGPNNYYPVNYDNTHEMFDVIRSCYQKADELLGGIPIIPVGEAVQLAIDEYGYNDALNTDTSLHNDTVSHLNTRGCYLAACVWIEKVFGEDCRTATYVTDGLTESDCTLLRKVAHETVTGETDTVIGDFRVLDNPTGLTVTRFKGTVPADGKIVIPETLAGRPITGISTRAFERLHGITEISLSKFVTNVEDGALTVSEKATTTVNKMSFDNSVANNEGSYFINWWKMYEYTNAINSRTENGNWLIEPTSGRYNATVFYCHVSGNHAWDFDANYINFADKDHTGNNGNSIFCKNYYVVSNNKFNNSFLKVSRLFGNDKKLFTNEDIGRTFNISFWLYLESCPNNSSAYLTYGLCPIAERGDPDKFGYGFYGKSYPTFVTMGQWKQFSFKVTLDEKCVGLNQIGLLGIHESEGPSPKGDGSDATTYYLDDITVEELGTRTANIVWRDTTRVAGDCNGDGIADISDLGLLKKKLAGVTDEDLTPGADFDGSGALDISDLALLKKKLAGLI